MENASKALIIAGAILISILLITLGIYAYTQAQSTVKNTNLNSQEVQVFNQKISQYCGTRKSDTDMNGLVSAISASNGAQKNLTDKHYILLTVDGTIDSNYYTGNSTVNANIAGTTTSLQYPSFSGGITYKAEYQIGADGYITSVTISHNN